MIRDTLRLYLSRLFVLLGVFFAVFLLWQTTKQVPTTGDWQSPFTRLSTAEFNDDLVTVKNVRNFRYNGSETEDSIIPNYYDKTYDLTKLTKVWYVSEPFKNNNLAAHTFLSFEFSNGDFLSITIEARKLKGQKYSLAKGAIRTYPLIYIAADERDAFLVRTNTRKGELYLYPVRTEKGRELFVSLLEEMNSLAIKPQWYNTITDNCTSRIAEHVNRVTNGRIPNQPWQGFVTGYADVFALEHGLLDTDLTIEKAREKYSITKHSQEIGDVEDYSQKIRQFEE
ncbi:MAG: DUF4105 domain-containing protein [Candidatus Magasanikbacteria bacterium]|nr:DUF4105 domain-containing protein [Candidatus Magasanikbacteria bacterium]MCA9389186.1 DUF4105 domain-containing protein [Candidatus Magasanikbacteria bacterium]MCA9390970.1 DUF4105 domain-containing protein [Candidatus Magasanikbacteria bacterium]USN52124.1 MAG: DUF4105 domain-containing protein [Candidatus Nomurabacteria bacterium]HPF95035.1 DUF4105 domain-containing protein [bacterium]